MPLPIGQFPPIKYPYPSDLEAQRRAYPPFSVPLAIFIVMFSLIAGVSTANTNHPLVGTAIIIAGMLVAIAVLRSSSKRSRELEGQPAEGWIVDRRGLAEGIVAILLGVLLFVTVYGHVNGVDFYPYNTLLSALGLVLAIGGTFWVLVSLRG